MVRVVRKYDKSVANRAQLGLNVLYTHRGYVAFEKWNEIMTESTLSTGSGLHLSERRIEWILCSPFFVRKKQGAFMESTCSELNERIVFGCAVPLSVEVYGELDGTFHMRLVRKYLQSTHKNGNF